MYTHADFCAGIGGFTFAFKSLAKTIYAVDIDDKCKLTYDLNHDIQVTLQDINEIKVNHVPYADIFTMGLPCQPFSLMGKRHGFNDKRSNVFWKMVEILKAKQPKCLIIENVKHLVSHDQGKSLLLILNSLKEIGYHCTYSVLNTCKATIIPQNRERIYIVGFLDEHTLDMFTFPKQDKTALDWRQLLDANVPDKFYYTKKSKIFNKLLKGVISKDTVYVYKAPTLRSVFDGKLFPTLRASMGTGGNNVPIILTQDNQIRKITPRECFRLQGFPDDFILPDITSGHLYVQAGNTITVPVARLIAKEAIICLSYKELMNKTSK